jgi:hypothetical protein
MQRDSADLVREFVVPISPDDIIERRLEACADFLMHWPAFEHRGHDRTLELLARAFGYDGLTSLKPMITWDRGLLLTLPEREVELAELAAWRLYVFDHVPIGETFYAFREAFKRVRLSVVECYNFLGLREDCCSVLPSRSEPLEQLYSAVEPFLGGVVYALAEDGRVFYTYLYETAVDIASAFWSPDCGISLQTLARDVVECGWMSLDTAIRCYGDAVKPPGLQPVCYFGYDGRQLGYGFASNDIGGLLAYIYPDSESFAAATVALWYSRSVPASLIDIPYSSVFVGEYQNPFLPPIPNSPPPWEVEIEMGDAPPHERDVVPFLKRRINCGCDVECKGSLLTRPCRSHDRILINDCFGFTLQPCPDENRCDWLQAKTPAVLPEETVRLMDDLYHSAQLQGTTVLRRLNAPAYLETVRTYVRRTNCHRRDQTAFSSEVQMVGNMGMVRAFDVPDAGETIKAIYPEFSGTPSEVAGEYALDYWSKNEIRHHHAHHTFDAKFLAYALLRNLSLDPFAYFGRSSASWMTLVPMVLSALADWPDTFAEQATLVDRVGRRLVDWGEACQQLFDYYDRLDTSMSSSWLWPEEAHPGYLRFSRHL